MDSGLNENIGNPKRAKKTLYWRTQVEAYQKSKLSVRAFCQQQQISWNTFRYHLYRFRDDGSDTSKPSEQHKFIPIGITQNHFNELNKNKHIDFVFRNGNLDLKVAGFSSCQLACLISLIGDWYAQSNNDS